MADVAVVAALAVAAVMNSSVIGKDTVLLKEIFRCTLPELFC